MKSYYAGSLSEQMKIEGARQILSYLGLSSNAKESRTLLEAMEAVEGDESAAKKLMKHLAKVARTKFKEDGVSMIVLPFEGADDDVMMAYEKSSDEWIMFIPFWAWAG